MLLDAQQEEDMRRYEERTKRVLEFVWFCLFVAFCVGLVFVIFATPERP